jgi:sugar/nucleoside kinase (ribokinase family)
MHIIKGIGVVGSTTIDEIISPGKRIFKIGGATAYAGITYCRHLIDTTIISNIARVDRAIIDRLEQDGITVFNGETNRTTHFINTVTEDARRQKVIHRARPILLRQLLPALKHIDGLHLSPLHPDDIEPKILKELSHFDLGLFIDIQGYTREIAENAVLAAASRHLSVALKAAHIIKANHAEIRLVLEHFQKDLAEVMKNFEIDEAVITSDRKGGWVQTLSGEKYPYTADRIASVTDPTGAGDVFFAAYLLSRFTKKQDIADSCRYAAVTAAKQVEGTYISLDNLALP